MDLNATYTFDASPAAVWDLLIDPAALAACLPGCELLEPTGEHTYRAVLTIGVAAVTGRYEATVTIADARPPSSYRLVVDGTGAGGFARGEAQVHLTEVAGGTSVSVSGRAQVGGTVARVGQRLLGSVSKMMMDRVFACLARRAGAAGG